MAKKQKTSDPMAMLNELVASSSTKETTAKASKNPIVHVNGKLETLVEAFTASDVIAKITEQHRKGDEGELKTVAFDTFLDQWADGGNKPTNPTFKTQHASVQLQVRNTYKIEGATTVDETVALLPEAVQAALAPFIKMETNLTTRPLDALMQGNPAEQEAAKAVLILLKTLPEDQRKLVLESKPKLTVDAEGLSAALANACGNDRGLMAETLQVLQPQLALAQAKNDQALAVASARFEKARQAEAA